MSHESKYDAVVIGGGFYGSTIAIYLSKQRKFKKVLLIEKESSLLSRASYNNQARVHNGYHYPRNFTTAYRSRMNLPRFLSDWSPAIEKNFMKIYAIARENSKVTGKQFENFCHKINAKIYPLPSELQKIFEPRLIEKAFVVEEYAFDSKKISDLIEQELKKYGVTVLYQTQAHSISQNFDGTLDVRLGSDDLNVEEKQTLISHYVFNCTYSGLNQLQGQFPGTKTQLKHELTEMLILRLPSELQDLGITVMDGPFFSFMPFPAYELHTLSHVRYTPHLHWNDEKGIDPYQKLKSYAPLTHATRMIRDVKRYIPKIDQAKHVHSLFEIKTVLTKNEMNDGRPILFEKHTELKGCFSILGGKIDNIYDIFSKLDNEPLPIF